jgi:Holliday junction DNA helicase RuvB
MLLRRPGDLVGLLVKMRPNSALLVDEIHSLPKPVAEVLYEVLEDGKLSTLVGSGAETVAVTHQMEGFVCIGATTRPGLLSAPFRGRFGFVGQVDPYSADELAEIVTKAWQRVGVEASEGEALAVATRCRYVPRRALHLAERVLDWTSVAGIDGVPSGTVSAALTAFGIDELGLDGNDWRVLAALTQTFSGRTVGLDALGSALDMDAASIENEIEPYLIQSGYVSRTKSGRMGLPAAYELFRESA